MVEVSRRDRKKGQTRLAISAAATGLFLRHGFDEVSLAQVADAADVSVKTIFNHFGGKEELFFDRIDEVLPSVLRAILDRPPGTPPLAGLRESLVERSAPFPAAIGDYAGYRRFLQSLEASPALRARRLLIQRDAAAAVAGVLADELGRAADSPEAAVLAAMVGAVLQLLEQTFDAAAVAGAGVDELRRQVGAVVGEALRRLAAAFPELAVQPGAGKEAGQDVAEIPG